MNSKHAYHETALILFLICSEVMSKQVVYIV